MRPFFVRRMRARRRRRRRGGVEAIEIENAKTKYSWEWSMDAKLFQPMHFSNISQSQKNFKLFGDSAHNWVVYTPFLLYFVSSPSHPKDKKKDQKLKQSNPQKRWRTCHACRRCA